LLKNLGNSLFTLLLTVALKGQSHPKMSVALYTHVKRQSPCPNSKQLKRIYFLISLFLTSVNISNGDTSDLIPVSSATYNIEMYFPV